jgi:hypothetical protein
VSTAAWHDYFFMVGGGAAALTGLVFVAMTLHLKEIATHPVHRHRARTILAGFTAVFIRCGLVLMGGQNRQAVAVELLVVVAGVEVILLRSFKDAAPAADTGVLFRTLGSFGCLLAEQAGAMVLFAGGSWGLYAVGAGMMSSFVFMVSGAWLLLVGVGSSEETPATVPADKPEWHLSAFLEHVHQQQCTARAWIRVVSLKKTPTAHALPAEVAVTP